MEIRKKGLLAASFGTAHADVRKRSISLLEEQIHAAFPERNFYRCYTSPTVRKLMERREGIRTDGTAEALERMAAEGMDDILVFATHVIPGIESEQIAWQAGEFRDAHPEIQVRLTKPLLWSEEDYRVCAGILLEKYGTFLTLSSGETEKNVWKNEPPRAKAEAFGENALIFFGHGTQHAGDACYERLENVMRSRWSDMSAAAAGPNGGPGQIYVITVEGSRTAADILPELKAGGIKNALLLPFLLTAGEHVMHDMAGEEPGSVKNLLAAEGIHAVPVQKGLGEYKEIREYYIRRSI